LVRLLAPVGAGDVAGLASRLIDRFGSLSAVIAADTLTRSIFLRENRAAAEQLDIVQEMLRHATSTDISRRPLFPNTLAAADYLMVRLAEEQAEQVRALYLDSCHMLIRDECASRGSIVHAPIYPREIVRRALELGASSLILAHNNNS
jgi:DNA repair protein RadC